MRLLRRVQPLARLGLFLSLSLNAALATSYPALLLLTALAFGLLLAIGTHRKLFWFALLLFVSWLPITGILFASAGYTATGSFVAGLWLGGQWMGLYLLRLLCILVANLVVIAALSPRECIQTMQGLGLPPKVVIFFTILIRFMPASLEEARRIIDAQRCRGFRPKKLLNPLNFLPIMTPLFIAQLKRSQEMVLCLEVRHFLLGASRSAVKLPRLSLADVLVTLAAGLLFAVPYMV